MSEFNRIHRKRLASRVNAEHPAWNETEVSAEVARLVLAEAMASEG